MFGFLILKPREEGRSGEPSPFTSTLFFRLAVVPMIVATGAEQVGSQDGPKRPQDEPKITGAEQVGSQDGPKRPQDAPKMGSRGPEMLQDAPR